MPRAFLVKKRGPKRGSPSLCGGSGCSPNGGSLSPEVGLSPKDAIPLNGLSGSTPEEARGWKGEVRQGVLDEGTISNGLQERCTEIRAKTPPSQSPSADQGETPLTVLDGRRGRPLSLLDGRGERPHSPLDGRGERPHSPLDGRAPYSPLDGHRERSHSPLDGCGETETDSLGAPRCTKDRYDAAPGGRMHDSRPRPELSALEATPPPPPVATAPGPRIPLPCGEISPDAAPEPEVMRFHRSPDAPTSGMTLTPVARSIGYITSSPTKTRSPRITIERKVEARSTMPSYYRAPVAYTTPPLPAAPPVSIKGERSPTYNSAFVSSSSSVPSSTIWAPHRDVGPERAATDFRSQSTSPSYPELMRRFPSPDPPASPPQGPSGINSEKYSPFGSHPQYDSDIRYGQQHHPSSHLPVSMFDRRHQQAASSSYRPALPALRPTGNTLPLNQLPDPTSGLGSSNVNPINMATSTSGGRNQNFLSPRKRSYSEDSLLREYPPRPLYDPRYHSTSTTSSTMHHTWAGDTQSAPLNMTTIKENNGECRTWRDMEGNGEGPRLKPRIPWGIENIPLNNDHDNLKSMLPPKKRRENDPPRYQCDACKKSYATHGGLSKHRQFHCVSIIKKEFSCKNCDKTYVSLGALKMHIRTHTLPCKCHLCGKSFARPWLLQGHVRTHTGEKPYQCAHCGRSFADRSNLRAHLQTHTDIKKYNCQSCSKSFSRMSLLTKHEDGGCGGVSI